MRTNIVMLAVLAGLGVSSSGAAMAEAKNLSCISGVAPNEQRLIRDCEPKPVESNIIVVIQPPPPPPPLLVKHGESKDGGPRGQGQDHDAPAGGGDPGSSF